ncbi:MAG: CYTH domain-containing protein [bacterium]|nr:CYTH domain-containing protein [bacterium]
MQTEVEVKFCRVDFDNLRVKLIDCGAKLVNPMRLMRRVIIDNEFMRTGKDGYLRIRDEGDKTTLTYKQFDSLEFGGAKEIEVTVSDYEKTVELFRQIGLQPKTFQETRREMWQLDNCEIVLDEWPWLDPYIEIEGASKAKVKVCAEKLGFDWNDAVFGDVMAAYRVQYPQLTKKDTIALLESAKFDDPLPELLR